MFLFPQIGEFNFGWLAYYYKENKLYFLGRRICYWNSEYEESKTTYKDFTKIYKKDKTLIIEMASKNIISDDTEYKNYPDYNDGLLNNTENSFLFKFNLENITFYKKYDNSSYEGDYNKMINNHIINPI